MSRVRVHGFSVSADGFGAGPAQDLEHPLGVGGKAVHQWLFATRTFQKMIGQEGGATGPDDDFAARGFAGIGASVMGRNMFGPVRGPWPDESWKGWWGETPPFHTPVFVLTHHARASIPMAGGTVFHFVTGGLQEAVALAKEAAGDRDVRIGGGVATLRAALEAGLVDEVHLAVAPVILGAGEALYAGLDLARLGYRVTERAMTEAAMHLVLTRG